MRLIFIRHAEPDYANNTLTERGFKEADLLSCRVPHWNVDRFFVSPLRRASLTAEPSLKKMNRTAETLPWMREFSYAIVDPITGKKHVPWDFMPQFWTNEPTLYDAEHFYEHPILQSADGYNDAVLALRKGLDALLKAYGYIRKGRYYVTPKIDCGTHSETNLVIFGHLGANLEAIGYLLGISPLVLQQTIYLAPTSVSILYTEERQPEIAMFRAQVLGDVTHLLEKDQPISESGAFAPIFNG